ncbi:MAG: glycosyl transferase family 1 [Planctomycetaceae bacterium]|nr:glycosyl transferase family 1 [Planctomycetaceae bacterium]
MSSTHVVYASFDRFPAPKGAATHIDAFVTALGRRFGRVDLLTIQSVAAELADGKSPIAPAGSAKECVAPGHQSPFAAWSADGVVHHPICAPGENLFERVLSFRSQSWNWWQERFGESLKSLPIIHFRSIFEGYPIARHKEQFCRKLVFEVNGLPSIELKYRYPNVADDVELLRKLYRQEQVCLDAADLVLTVSRVNAEHLFRRGVPENRVCVIPNGVDLDVFSYGRPAASLPGASANGCPMRMLYSGTMSAWQGVSAAIEALALFRRDFPATLTLVGHARPRQRRDLLDRAWELGVTDSVRLLEPVSKRELATLHHDADVIVAPLTQNDRNLVQGCCPLKVLEAMASGTPLIASDIPVVRELATNDVETLLVRPSSAKAIKDGMLRLKSEQGLARRLSLAARARAQQDFSWSRAQALLVNAYESLLS